MAYMKDIREQIEDVYDDEGWDSAAEDQRQMMEAVRSKNLEKFRRLMNRGVDSEFCDNFGNSPIHIVVGMPPNIRVSEIAKMLVYFGTSLNMQNRFGLTPLHIASTCSAEHVALLLDAGCAVDLQDNAGRTALMQVCMGDCKEALTILQYLMDRGANVQARDGTGLNALHYVCQNRKQDVIIRNEMVYRLLYAGLSSALKDNRDRLPIDDEADTLKHLTNVRSADLQVFQTLIQSGPNITPKMSTSIHWAHLLVKYGPSVLVIVHPTLCVASSRMLLSTLNKASSRSEDVIQRLQNSNREVSSLKWKSRIVIRKRLGGEMFVKAPILGLPEVLKNYVLLTS